MVVEVRRETRLVVLVAGQQTAIGNQVRAHELDGIRGRKFAVYLKLHHAYADGVTMTSWLSKTLAPEPAPDSYTPPWAMDTEPRRAPAARTHGLTSGLFKVMALARNQLKAAKGIAKIAAQQAIERTGLTEDAVALYFNTGRDTVMTGSASPGRGVGLLPPSRRLSPCRAGPPRTGRS